MKTLKNLPAPRGVWSAIWDVLIHPGTPFIAGVVLAVITVFGNESRPGEHPAEGVLFRLAIFTVALCLIARASALSHLRNRFGAVFLACGIMAMGFAQWNPGERTGRLEMGQSAVESYRRIEADREIPVHLGAQLMADKSESGATTLTLGIKDVVHAGPVKLSHTTGVEESLGNLKVYVSRTYTSQNARVAVLKVRPRDQKGWQSITLAPGEIHALGPNSTLRLVQLRDDYLGALGMAAQVQIQWDGGTRTAWIFADAADLDTRIGDAPWIAQLVSLEGTPTVEIGVRRGSSDPVMWLGLGLSLIGLLTSGLRIFGRVS